MRPSSKKVGLDASHCAEATFDLAAKADLLKNNRLFFSAQVRPNELQSDAAGGGRW